MVAIFGFKGTGPRVSPVRVRDRPSPSFPSFLPSILDDESLGIQNGGPHCERDPVLKEDNRRHSETLFESLSRRRIFRGNQENVR